jgi:hypothetical protein
MVKKITKANTAPLGLYPLKSLPKGEYVRRVDLCEECNGGDNAYCRFCGGKGYTKEYKTTWIKGEYCRGFGKHGTYELMDFDDINHCQYRSGSVLVLAGFTF